MFLLTSISQTLPQVSISSFLKISSTGCPRWVKAKYSVRFSGRNQILTYFAEILAEHSIETSLIIVSSQQNQSIYPLVKNIGIRAL